MTFLSAKVKRALEMSKKFISPYMFTFTKNTLLIAPFQKRQISSNNHEYDIVVIGGGIIGSAVAKTLKEKIKNVRVALLEKEHAVAEHQSGHNSNVVHAGIYYQPESLKARTCVKGANLVYDYCEKKKIAVKKSGKLIVAGDWLESRRLEVLFRNGVANRVPGLEILKNWNQVGEIQPNCKGVRALWSPNTGNINWKSVTEHLVEDFKREGGDVHLDCRVKRVKESNSPERPLFIEVDEGRFFLAKYAVLCLGLHSGTLDTGTKNDYKNISLKVNYQLLNPRLSKFVKTNIYAMPNIDMPFIGVHLSPLVDGGVLLGPSAVPALKLDGYKSNEFDVSYVQNNVLSKGFGLLFLKNFRTCLNQVLETACGDVRTRQLRKYFPMICENDVLPGPVAVQGQVVTSDGDFVDDFIIEVFEGEGITKRLINCRFIPSPGATCSLALAELLSERMEKMFV